MRGFRKRIVVWLNVHGMLKIFAIASLFLLLVFMFVYELPAAKTWTHWTLPLTGKVIALDAGHGGPDGGASSKEGLIEKDVNLAITLFLRDYLQQAGAIVIMTREEDKDLAQPDTKGLSRRKTEDLLQRAEYIQKNKANMFISIHLNSFPSGKWTGAQTFYSSVHEGSSVLAAHIQNELKRNLENTDRVPKTLETNYLLKTLNMPAALIEVGFLSNSQEARLMATEKYQKKVSASIYQGILKYCSGEKVGSP